MPFYCYTTRAGHTEERWFPMGKAPRSIRINGRVAHRDIAAEHAGFLNTPGTYPYYSDAAGVAPDQVPAARAALRKHGLCADFHKDGRLKFESPGHRKAVCEAIGLFDRNGGYGDPRRRGLIAEYE